MTKKKIIKRTFKFMAEFGCFWGWQIDYFDDGTTDYYGMAGDFETEIDNGKQTANISPVLARAIQKWCDYYENYNPYGKNDNMDWHNFHKIGLRLAKLLAKQIGHLYDEIYYRRCEGGIPVDIFLKKTENSNTIKIFRVMADFGGAWGWIEEDNQCVCSNEFIADEINDCKISGDLLVKISLWQSEFEWNAYDDYCARQKGDFEKATFDWDTWNETGIRLAHRLEQEIGHLFDEFYYDYAFEDKDFTKVWKDTELKIK